MKIKLNNDMELILNNENGSGDCIASLVDTDGEILCANVINEQALFEFVTSHMSNEKNPWTTKVAELRLLKEGDPILVCDGQLAYFEAYEPTENGDYTIWFTDNGLYKNPKDGEYYDLKTDERVDDYIGNCSLGEFIGRAAHNRALPLDIQLHSASIRTYNNSSKTKAKKAHRNVIEEGFYEN